MTFRPTSLHLALLTLLVLLALPTTTPAAGSSPTLAAAYKLNPPGSVIRSFGISPADSRVVFLAGAAQTQPFEVYSVPVTGGTPLKLNAPLAPTGTVSGLWVSPPGGRAVYVGQHANDPTSSLYSVPTTGGEPQTLASPSSLGGEIDDTTLSLSPNGNHALFRVRTTQFGGLPLYRVATAGGTPQKVGDNVLSFTVTPDSTRVLYVVSAFPNQLWSAPLDGSAEPVILTAIPENSSYTISPDSSRVVYAKAGPFGEVLGLVTQPIAGGNETMLYTAEMGGPSLLQHALMPNGSRVVYTIRTSDNGQTTIALRSVPLTGGESTPIGVAISPATSVATVSLYPAPGGRVVYVASVYVSMDAGTATHTVMSAPVTGGTSVPLANLNGVWSQVEFSSDGANLALATSAGMYVGRTDGTTPLVKIGTSSVRSGPVLSSDGRAIFSTKTGVTAVTFDGTPIQQIDVPAGVTPLTVTLLDQTVVYVGDTNEVRELYAASLTSLDPKPFKVRLPLIRR